MPDNQTIIPPQIFPLGKVHQPSGDLCFWEQEIFPIKVKRAFWISDVPEAERKGVHAHIEDDQIIICLKGSVKADLEDLNGQVYAFQLKDPAEALFLPALVWSGFTFSPESILLVLSSMEYSEKDYIREKADFEKLQDGYRKKH